MTDRFGAKLPKKDHIYVVLYSINLKRDRPKPEKLTRSLFDQTLIQIWRLW